jgi:hypothetical protein
MAMFTGLIARIRASFATRPAEAELLCKCDDRRLLQLIRTRHSRGIAADRLVG